MSTSQLAGMQTSTKRSLPRYSDAFCVDILGGDGFLQFVQLSRLFQFLHQTFHCFFTPFLLLAVLLSFLPAQKSFDNGGSERKDWHLFEFSLSPSSVEKSDGGWAKKQTNTKTHKPTVALQTAQLANDGEGVV